MKKNMKKIMALALAATMTMGMTTAALAADIYATDVKEGETYTAYQILNYTDNNQGAYSYYLTADQYTRGLGGILERAGFAFTQSSDGTQYFVNNTNDLKTAGADAIVDALNTDTVKTELNSVAISTQSKEASEDEEVVFTDLPTGYYFIDSTLGSLCGLTSWDDEQMIVEKNEIPTIDKEVDDGNVSIGDKVTFTLTVTDKKGTDKEIIVHDIMSEGLDLVEGSFTIKVGEEEVEAGGDTFVINTNPTDGCTFEIVFKEAFVSELENNEIVTITYDALINEDAEVDSEEADNTWNKTWLNYSEQESEKKEVDLYTCKFGVNKVDGDGNALTGAEFELYKNNVKIDLVKDEDGFYRPATAEEKEAEGFESAVIEAGNVVLKGFEENTYELEEIKAPDGYNMLDERITIVLVEEGVEKTENGTINYASGVDVVNESGTVLPSTGGIGTTIFYVLGSILALASGVLLVTKKRMSLND